MPDLRVIAGGRTSRRHKIRTQALRIAFSGAILVAACVEFLAVREGLKGHFVFVSVIFGLFYSLLAGTAAGFCLYFIYRLIRN